MKVLVTGAGALLGQGIIRSLQHSTLKPFIIGVDPSPLSAGLYWVDKAHLIPMANSPDYLSALRKVIEHERPDAVIPGTDVELLLLAEARDILESDYGLHVIVSSPEVIQIADDKWLTAQFFKKHGFGYVPSCLPGEESAFIETYGFPLIVKPRVGARSIGFRHITGKEQLQQAISENAGLVIQKKVGGPDQEYTAGTLTFDDRCDAVIVMRRDLRDGNTYRAYVETSETLIHVMRKAAEALQAYGPANFQFMLDEGQIKVFEINARFSGTTPLRTQVGFNEVELTLRRVCEGASVAQPNVRKAIIMRHWSETVVHPKDVIGSVPVDQQNQ
jgi:carbamoyl-phosphate synthase large subunit